MKLIGRELSQDSFETGLLRVTGNGFVTTRGSCGKDSANVKESPRGD